MLAYPLIKQDNKLISLKFSFLKNIKNALKNKNKIKNILKVLHTTKSLKNQIYINNKQAHGLSISEINKIKKQFKEKDIEIKKSIAFVPSVFIAFIVLIVFGNKFLLFFIK